jgi:hypothetical protein
MPRTRISEKMAAKIAAYRAAKKELDDSRTAHKRSLDRARDYNRTTKLCMASDDGIGNVGNGGGDSGAPVPAAKVCHHCDTGFTKPSYTSNNHCSNSCAAADGWFKGRD